MEEITVQAIPSKMAHPWILKKHYARRLPPVQYAFGLIRNGRIEGVVTYGPPSTNQVSNSCIGTKYSKGRLLELNRLCCDTDIPCAASMLIGRSLKMLPENMVIVSYADTAKSHIGCVYQATNWLYCGLNAPADWEYLVDGKWTHSRTMSSRGFTNHFTHAKHNSIPYRAVQAKHRYVFLTGNKRQKRDLRKQLRWPILDVYPKGERVTYDAGGKLDPSETSIQIAEPDLFTRA